MDLTELSARRLRELIAAGGVSAVEAMTAHLDRIDELNPVVNAVATCDAEQALAAAATADKAFAVARSGGRLHGLPVAIKDLQATAGLRTTYGSPEFADHVPDRDGGIVARIRAAGGIVIAKTNIPERSIGANTVNPLIGATGNPFAPDRTCGGSSGGSGVALATQMAPLATGSDHGGSIRIPAAFCGVVGHRATPGLVPFEERTMTQNFYSVQGPMARNVSDLALLLSVVADRVGAVERHDPMMFPFDASVFAALDPVDLDRVRVGVSEDLGGLVVSKTIRRTFRSRVEAISRLAARCEESSIDLSLGPAVDWRLRADIFVTQYHREAQGWGPDFNPNIRASYDAALDMPMAEIAAARRIQADLNQAMQAVFDEFDVLVCPTVAVSPFPWSQRNPSHIDDQPIENYMAWLGLTSSLSVVGHPVTTIPCGLDEMGLPFGIQLVGPMYGDHRLLSIAAAFEAAFAADPTLARPVPDFDWLGAQRDVGCSAARM